MLNEQKIVKYMMTKHYDEQNYNCWDFVQDVYKDEYDYRLPDYPMGTVPAQFKDKLKSNINHIKIEKENAIEGDIVIFSLFADQHAGVMLDNDSFIHMSKTNVAVSQLSNLGGNYAIYRVVR